MFFTIPSWVTDPHSRTQLPNTPGANQAYHSDSSPSTDKESVATPTSTASDIRGIVVADDRLTIELKATVDRLTTENNDLKKTNSELLEQLNNSKRMRLTKDVELTALKAVNDSLQHHQIAVRAENEALHRNLAALKVENDRLQQELSTFRMENENLVRQLAFLQSELDTIATSVMSSSPQSRSYSAVKGSRSDARDCEYSVDSNWLVIDESESEISLAESSTCADHDTAALQRMLQATFREKLEAEKQVSICVSCVPGPSE
jgi:chromosome segregation ATPase